MSWSGECLKRARQVWEGAAQGKASALYLEGGAGLLPIVDIVGQAAAVINRQTATLRCTEQTSEFRNISHVRASTTGLALWCNLNINQP